MKAVEKAVPAAWSDAANRRRAILLRLATAPDTLAQERRVLPTTFAARLEALLGEIDDIVLPRLLHVRSGKQEVARLTVTHRRLVDVEIAGRPSKLPDSNALFPVLAARLAEIAKTRGNLSLAVGPRATEPSGAEMACSVASLREALELSTADSAFDRLFRLSETASIARLRWHAPEQQMELSGAPEWQGVLRSAAAGYIRMRAAKRADALTRAARTEGLLIPLGADLSIVIASLDMQAFACVIPCNAGLELIAVWQVP